MIPTTLRYSPLLQVSENGAVEMRHESGDLQIALYPYTGYAGWAVTAAIPVKFCTAHDRSRPEVGSGFPIEGYGRKGVPQPPRIFGTSEQKNITPTPFSRPKQNFFSLTVCTLEQYLQNGNENKILLP